MERRTPSFSSGKVEGGKRQEDGHSDTRRPFGLEAREASLLFSRFPCGPSLLCFKIDPERDACVNYFFEDRCYTEKEKKHIANGLLSRSFGQSMSFPLARLELIFQWAANPERVPPEDVQPCSRCLITVCVGIVKFLKCTLRIDITSVEWRWVKGNQKNSTSISNTVIQTSLPTAMPT